MKRTFIIIAGVLLVLVGLGFVFPAIALLRTTGSLPGWEIALLLLGIAMTLSGGGALFRGVSRRGA